MAHHGLSPKRLWLVLSGVALSLLLAALDNTIVGTAMPKIIRDLHGMEHYAWPFTAYMLFSTSIIPVAGKFSDVHGKKGVNLIGLAIFIGASALCGISGSMTQLVIFRGLQGIGGGIITSNAFIIVGELFPPRERAKYMGIMASMFGIASLLGPTVGGFITDVLSWRWVFYVNLPLGFISFFILSAALPTLAHEKARRIDYSGMVTFLLAVFPLLLGFSEGGKDYQWLSPQIVGLFAFSMAMFIVFISFEKRSGEPLLSLNLFRDSVFSNSVVSSFLGSAGMFGAIMFVPLFAQGVLGASATRSGFITTPMMVAMMSASTVTGLLAARLNKYRSICLVGFALTVLGMALLAFMGTRVSYPMLVANLMILGIGFGITVPITTIAPQNVFPVEELGTVTSAVQFFRSMGGAVSSAILGSMMLSSMSLRLKSIPMTGLPVHVQRLLGDPKFFGNNEAIERIGSTMPRALIGPYNAVISQTKTALALSIEKDFFICIFLLLAALVVTIFLDERRVQKLSDYDGASYSEGEGEKRRIDAMGGGP